MGILKFAILLLIFLLVVPLATKAEDSAKAKNQAAQQAALQAATDKLCHSTKEYIKALQFLRNTKELTFREPVARKIAHDVSKGCDGAAERFSMVILLLKNIGLSDRRSLAMALEFAGQSPEVQRNFVEIFTNAFLSEFFDYDYPHALKLAIELSKDYTGDPKIVREDFLRLVRFCKESTGPNNLDLPIRLCADYVAKIAHSSQFYPGGIAQIFLDFFSKLRDSKDYLLDIRGTLRVAEAVLRSGPTAVENFTEAFDFGRQDLALDKQNSLQFAMDLSSRSYVGQSPPVMQFPHPSEEKK